MRVKSQLMGEYINFPFYNQQFVQILEIHSMLKGNLKKQDQNLIFYDLFSIFWTELVKELQQRNIRKGLKTRFLPR